MFDLAEGLKPVVGDVNEHVAFPQPVGDQFGQDLIVFDHQHPHRSSRSRSRVRPPGSATGHPGRRAASPVGNVECSLP